VSNYDVHHQNDDDGILYVFVNNIHFVV